MTDLTTTLRNAGISKRATPILNKEGLNTVKDLTGVTDDQIRELSKLNGISEAAVVKLLELVAPHRPLKAEELVAPARAETSKQLNFSVKSGREYTAARRAQLAAQGHTGPLYEINHPVPASGRNLNRFKRRPFRNCYVTKVEVRDGLPAMISWKHYHRKGEQTRPFSEKLIGLFPDLPGPLYASLMGAS